MGRKLKLNNTQKSWKWSRTLRKRSRISRANKKKFVGQSKHGSKQPKENSTAVLRGWRKKESKVRECSSSGSITNLNPSFSKVNIITCRQERLEQSLSHQSRALSWRNQPQYQIAQEILRRFWETVPKVEERVGGIDQRDGSIDWRRGQQERWGTDPVFPQDCPHGSHC